MSAALFRYSTATGTRFHLAAESPRSFKYNSVISRSEWPSRVCTTFGPRP